MLLIFFDPSNSSQNSKIYTPPMCINLSQFSGLQGLKLTHQNLTMVLAFIHFEGIQVLSPNYLIQMGLNLLRFLVVLEFKNIPILQRELMWCWYSKILTPSTFLLGSPFLLIQLFLSYIYSALLAISIMMFYKLSIYSLRIFIIESEQYFYYSVLPKARLWSMEQPILRTQVQDSSQFLSDFQGPQYLAYLRTLMKVDNLGLAVSQLLWYSSVRADHLRSSMSCSTAAFSSLILLSNFPLYFSFSTTILIRSSSSFFCRSSSSNLSFSCNLASSSSFLCFSSASFFLCSSFLSSSSCFLVSLGAALGGIRQVILTLNQQILNDGLRRAYYKQVFFLIILSLLILIMSSLQSWKERWAWTWGWLTQKEVLKVVGVGAFMLGAFFGFRFFNKMGGPSIMRIKEIHDSVVKCQEKAENAKESLVVDQCVTTESKNITMQFILVSKLKQKQRENNELVRNPFLPPFQEGLFIRELGMRHRLLFNKFNLYQNHLLVVTKEFQPQSNLINKEDFRQAILAFRAVKGFYFYNSGPKAGASQTHKHIQIFPNQAKDLPMFRSILEYCRELKYKKQESNEHENPQVPVIHEFPAFNFKHGLILLGNSESSSESDKGRNSKNSNNQENILKLKANTIQAYLRLHKSLIPNCKEGEQPQAYNLIGCQHFLMMIPRRKQKAFNDLSVNAIGFMGSVLFKDKNLMRKYINQNRQGYEILEDITYSKKL